MFEMATILISFIKFSAVLIMHYDIIPGVACANMHYVQEMIEISFVRFNIILHV